MVTHGVLVIVKDWHGQPCDAVDKRDASKCKRWLKLTGVYLNIVKHSGSAGSAKTEDLTFLIRLVEDGRIGAVIDRSDTLEPIVEARR
jgi:hypothetical protein